MEAQPGGKLGLPKALGIARDIARGLQELHNHRVIALDGRMTGTFNYMSRADHGGAAHDPGGHVGVCLHSDPHARGQPTMAGPEHGPDHAPREHIIQSIQ